MEYLDRVQILDGLSYNTLKILMKNNSLENWEHRLQCSQLEIESPGKGITEYENESRGKEMG